MTMSGSSGESATIDVDGSVYTRGEHAGDGFVDMSVEGLANGVTMQVVRSGGTVSLVVNGQRRSIPAGAAQANGDDVTGMLAKLDLEKYVKDVSVSSHEVLDGKSVTKIVGVLDTSAFVRDFGSETSSAGQVPAEVQGLIPSVARGFGDTRVVLFVDDDTHLLDSALVDLDLHQQGKTMHLAVDYGLTSVDKPVDFPVS
jgi:hypothetical protein